MRLDQDERLFVDAKWVFDVLRQHFGETVTYGIMWDMGFHQSIQYGDPNRGDVVIVSDKIVKAKHKRCGTSTRFDELLVHEYPDYAQQIRARAMELLANQIAQDLIKDGTISIAATSIRYESTCTYQEESRADFYIFKKEKQNDDQNQT